MIGNHTYSHMQLTKGSRESFKEELVSPSTLSCSVLKSVRTSCKSKELTELVEELKDYLYRCKGYAVIQGRCYYVDGTMAQIDILEVPRALSVRIVLLYRASGAVRRRCQAYLDRSGK